VDKLKQLQDIKKNLGNSNVADPYECRQNHQPQKDEQQHWQRAM
jgi:hypothetical protein